MTTTPATWTPTPTVAPKCITGAWLKRTPPEEQAGVLVWLDGAKRGARILANLRRLAEGDRLPAHVRAWVDRQGAGAPGAAASPAPTPTPCEGCGVSVSVVVVSDACPGKRLCGDCESGEGPHAPPATEGPHALVAAANQEAADAYDRLDRERDRSERLLQAVENIGRALVRARMEARGAGRRAERSDDRLRDALKARTKGGGADDESTVGRDRPGRRVGRAGEAYSGDLLRLRPSSLDLAMACPASAYDLGARVEPDTEPARAGSALHELIAQSIRDDHLRMDLLDATCERYELGAPSASDVSRRLRRAWRCWAQDGMSAAFPAAEVEQRVAHTLPGGVEIRGSGDVGALVGSVVRIADWKSGHRLGGHEHQVRSYARGWLDRYPEAERAQAWVIPLEHLDDPRIAREAAHAQTWTRQDLDQWAERVERRVVGWDRSTYSPGDHCSRCPLRISCPAIEGEERRRANLLAPFAGPKGAALVEAIRERTLDLSDDDKALLWSAAGLAGRIGKATRDALRPEVLERGGFAGLTVSRQKRSEVLPRPGWPVLAERMTDEEIARAVRIGLGECDQAVMDKAPPRGKAAAKRELREALSEAGALVETTFTRVLDRGEA